MGLVSIDIEFLVGLFLIYTDPIDFYRQNRGFLIKLILNDSTNLYYRFLQFLPQ